MPVISIPVRWIEAINPSKPRTGYEIKIVAAMTYEQIQATLNDMAAFISERAWRAMVEKTFEEQGR